MSKRKEAEREIIKWIDRLDPSKENSSRYAKMFAKMSDKEFHEFMVSLKEKKEVLFVYVPNMKIQLSLENLREVSHDLNIEMFERLRLYDAATDTTYLTPNKYLVLDATVRRMSQYLDHKLQVPNGDSHIDILTGQVVKPDKGAGISQVEIQALGARDLKQTIREIIKYRGGDISAGAQYRRELEETGETSIANETGSVARSGAILDVLFSGMHIESNATGI